LTVTGTAHWSVRGDIKKDTWIWWVEIKGVTISDKAMRLSALASTEGVAFITEFEKFLPDDPRQYISEPDSVPGGSWDINIALKDCKSPLEAEGVIKKFFPNLYALA
jgi:hypothetical protein